MTTMVYLSLTDMHAAAYLATDCQLLVSDDGRCQLRFADSSICVVRRTTATLETDVSRPLARSSGTIFQLVLGKRTSVLNIESCR